MLEVLLTAIGLAVGAFLGFLYNKKQSENSLDSAEQKSKKLLEEAKNKSQSMIFEAQEKSVKILNDAKNEITEEKKSLKTEKESFQKREIVFDEKLLSLEDKQSKLSTEKESLEKEKVKITELINEQSKKLQEVAGLTKDDAKSLLMKTIETEFAPDIAKRIREVQKLGVEDYEKESKKILMLAMQRFSIPLANDITTTNVQIPNDEMKGRIIGKEGRNIKIFEQITGVELIVDDTPGVIIISSFNPIRRHIAKKTLDMLITDGRIQPARIEEFVERSKEELALDIKKAGEEAVAEVGVGGFDSKLVQILGRLKYRTSYGQNILNHSIEVAIISGLIAAEVGADVAVARKGGLLHDIGKAVDFEVQGTHPEIGRNIAIKFGLPESIIAPIAYHHDDIPPTLEATIVKIADAISGSRPGSRKDSIENYVQRLNDLENIATRNERVTKAYAISAGRELRIFANSDLTSDLEALNLAKKIANDVENELKYPGEIKITMIREKRIVEYAK